MEKAVVRTTNAPAPIGPYNQAIIANGKMLFVAGQVPIDPATGQVVAGDIKDQTRRALENVGAILKEGGASFTTVVKTTVFLKDMNEFAAMNDVYERFFPQLAPARSTVEVARLLGIPNLFQATIAALEARNRDLQSLVEAATEDASHLSTDDVLESVARRLARLTHSPVADIYAVEGETLRALVSYDHGSFDRSWEGTTVRLRDYPCSAAAVGQRRVSVASSLDDPVLTTIGRASLEKWGYQSQLAAPLVARDAVIGILELSDYVPRDFSEHLELIEGLAHVAGRALDNAALFDEIRRRNVILHELVEFGALVARAGDVTELLRVAAKRLVETLDAADCDVFTLEGDRLLSRVSYDRNGYDDDSVGHSLRVDDFPNVKAAIESQEIAVIASPDDPHLDIEERRVFEEWGFKSNLSLPLVVDGVVHGLIDIYDDKPSDYAGYLDFLMTVGQLLAGALGKARLLERLEESNNELRELVDSGLEFGSSLELDEVLLRFLGDPKQSQAEFAEISPLNHIDQVKIPVLVAYGGSDPVVSVDQSKRLIAELKRQKVPCEVLIKRDEGHGMARLDDQVEYYTMVEKFLARNLAKP